MWIKPFILGLGHFRLQKLQKITPDPKISMGEVYLLA